MWAGLKFSETELGRLFKIIAGASGILSVVFLAVSVDPEKTLHPFFEHRLQFEFAQLTHPTELVQSILPDVQAAAGIFTEGYTLSSILNFDLQQYAHAHGITLPEVSIWGSGSRFGREFDWTQNFKALDGKRVVIITPGPFPISFWEHYFTSLKTEERSLKGQKFYVSTGEGFKTALYLKVEFRKPIETYYREMATPCSLWDLTHDPAMDLDFGGVIVGKTPIAELAKRLGCGQTDRAACCLGPDHSFIVFGSDETSSGMILTDVIVDEGMPPAELKCAVSSSPQKPLSNAIGMKLGLNPEEVSNLLGKPNEVLKDGSWKYVYDYLETHVYRTYEIQFHEGKVISFQVKQHTRDGSL
jgi:hypothetical protein